MGAALAGDCELERCCPGAIQPGEGLATTVRHTGAKLFQHPGIAAFWRARPLGRADSEVTRPRARCALHSPQQFWIRWKEYQSSDRPPPGASDSKLRRFLQP